MSSQYVVSYDIKSIFKCDNAFIDAVNVLLPASINVVCDSVKWQK